MNGRTLVNRDPAMAALMGAFAVSAIAAGGDFGTEGEFSFGDDYGDDVGFGDDDVGFGAAAHHHMAHAAPKPTAAQAIAAYHKHHAQKSHGKRRQMLLDPNAGSDVKIERYSFSLSDTATFGTAAAMTSALSGAPDTDFRPQIVTMNAPFPGFAYIQNIKVANVSVTVGPGLEDAYNYSAASWGRSLDMPTLTPANRATVSGSYTAFVPPGYVQGTTYTFGVNFKGPALLAGGLGNL